MFTYFFVTRSKPVGGGWTGCTVVQVFDRKDFSYRLYKGAVDVEITVKRPKTDSGFPTKKKVAKMTKIKNDFP